MNLPVSIFFPQDLVLKELTDTPKSMKEKKATSLDKSTSPMQPVLIVTTVKLRKDSCEASEEIILHMHQL